MKLLVATRSSGKRREMRRLFADSGIEPVFPEDAGVAETPAEALLELHDSFRANAWAKAEFFGRKTGLPTVADDSGLEVFSLGGEPGVKSRRWAQADGPPDAVDAANNALLLRRLAGAPESRRRARYRCVLALYRAASAPPEFFEGACTGLIVAEARGSHGFGYDPFFLSDDLDQTFGEADDTAKDEASHRGRAVRALLAALANHPL
ncbi:MAG: non-canonical purine NTP pyrophosphatase [Gemmatimonadales bacterium]